MSTSGFLKTLAEEIEAEELFGPHDHIVVGVSGGADSMALLHALLGLNTLPGYRLSLHIAHLNHQLRGEDAEHDAAFVQAAGDDRGLPCTIERRDIQQIARDRKGSLEEVARGERYEFFGRVCLRTGARLVAVGHQADDNAETILHRIVRGTGLRGMAGIPRKRRLRPDSDICIIRPLLRYRRKTLIGFLSDGGIPFREDRTNEANEPMRNRIRNQVLPQLEAKINSQVRDALLRLGEQARWLEEYLSATVQRQFETLVVSRTDQELVLNAITLAAKSRLVQTELIRRAIASFQIGEQDVNFHHMVVILDLLAEPASGRQAHLPGGMTVSKRYNRLIFSLPTEMPRETIAAQIAVHVPGTTVLPIRRMEIASEIGPVTSQEIAARRHNTDRLTQWFDYDAVHLPLVVRRREAGDRFWPLGAPGSKSLAEFLSDNKVDPVERDRVAVLCDQLGPIWVIGHRIDDRVKLTLQTRTALRVNARFLESKKSE